MQVSKISTAALFVIAAVLIAVNSYPLFKRWLQSDMDAVVEASSALRYRPSLARLSAGFAYRPVAPRKRGDVKDAIGDPQYSPLWPLINRLSKESGPRHSLGVSYLLTGNPAAAAQVLEQTLRSETQEQGDVIDGLRRSTNAPLLNDLAVAYQALIEQTGDLTLRPAAMEAALRAWSLEKTPQIAWTRAVIVEAHHVREQSIAAWREYLTLEPHSEWSDAARRHLQELQRPTDAELWPSVRDRLPENLHDVGRFRQEVRLWCEDELLPQWAAAALRGDGSAAELLAKAEILGRALEQASGEREVAGAVEAIRKTNGDALARLAKGHAAYGARKSAGLQAIDTAVATLTPDLTPFAWRARIEHAAAVYGTNDYAAARAELQALPADAPLSRSCKARVEAILGIVELQTGSYQKAADHYLRAIEEYRAIGERAYEATLLSRLASAVEFAGDSAAARMYREQASQALDRIGDPKPRHDVMIDAAYLAFVSGQYASADLYFDALVANDLASKNNVTACTSLMWRSAYRYRRHLLDPAYADLADAQRVCASIPAPAARERGLANLELAKLIEDPNANGDAAIDYYKRTNSHVWLPTAYFVRAQRLAQRGDAGAAERDFRAALTETNAMREKIDDSRVRVEFTATADEIADGYVEFLLQQHREQDAFDVADRSRLRELVDSPTARWRAAPEGPLVPRVQTALPFGTVFVEYRVLSKSIVVWVAGPGSFDTVTLPVSIQEVKQVLAHLNAEAQEPALRTHASFLYDALVRRIEPLLKDARALVIVPDDELERVPFSALYDRLHGRYLVDTRATAVASSAALFLQSQARARERSQGSERMVVLRAATGGKTTAALPEAAAEANSIATLYPNARVIDGAGATGPALLSQARDASLLQFVGHTRMASDGSSLALRLGDAPRAQVTMADVLAAPLPRLRLVYLSACETDNGPVLKSEGSVTIARSFFAAGIPVVIGTLWPVDDGSARLAARMFHEHLRRGDTPAESLRQAQLAVRSHDGNSRVDWAAFRVIGAGL